MHTGHMTSIGGRGCLPPGGGFCNQGGLHPGGLPPGGSALGGGGPSGTRKAGSTHPTRMLSCLESVIATAISVSSSQLVGLTP